MKKVTTIRTLAACSLLGLFGTASAQVNTQIYGVVDIGVEHVNNASPGGGGITRMQFGTAPSRLGFRGVEDLGGGLKATFLLENGFNADTGSLANGGRLFGRASTVGLSGPWGAATVGRQLTMIFWALADTELMIPGVYSSGTLDPYLANARADNSIAYRGSFNGFTLGATYSLGRDSVNTNSPGGTNCAGEVAGNNKACREASLMLKYDDAAWGVALGSDRIYGNNGAFGGLTRSDLNDTRTVINGYVKFGGVKLTAGYMRRDNEGSPALRKSDLSYVGASYTTGPWRLEGEVLDLDFKNSANGATLSVLRGFYDLSKRTALYTTAGHIKNRGTSAIPVSGFPGVPATPGISQNGVMVGVRHTF